jgi:ribosomal protein L13E
MSEKAAKKKGSAKETGAKKSAKKAVPKQIKTRKAAKVAPKEPKAEAVDKAVEFRTIPVPVVLARHEYGMQERDARGYSLGELASVGVSFNVAKRMKVPIDIRRRSVLEGNVGSLKSWYVPEPKKPKVETGEKAERLKKRAEKKAALLAKKSKKAPKPEKVKKKAQNKAAKLAKKSKNVKKVPKAVVAKKVPKAKKAKKE